MKIIFAMRSKPAASKPAGRRRGHRRAAAAGAATRRWLGRQSRRLQPRNCAGRSSGNDTGGLGTGAPAPASCMPLLRRGRFDGMKRRIRKRIANEGDDAEQHHHDDVAELGAEAEVAHQRGDAEAGGEAGDRAHPRAARRRGGGRAPAVGRRGGCATGAAGLAGTAAGARGGTLRCMPAEPPPPMRRASAAPGTVAAAANDEGECQGE